MHVSESGQARQGDDAQVLHAIDTRRREILGIIGLVALGGALLSPRSVLAASVSGLSNTEASAGLKEALIKGSETAVNLLGQPGGFLDNAKVRIPLPEGLKKAQAVLRMMGRGQQAEELEVAMNRAAESAVQEAKPLLVNAVQTMTVQDAKGILTGGDDSVTTYFKGKTQTPLAQRFLPIVSKEIDKLGLAQMYNQYAGQAAQFGVIRKEDANVQQYVTRKALDGLYLMIGEQERSIRADPIGTGSAILRKVFGAVK
jgi:hypothetical protein